MKEVQNKEKKELIVTHPGKFHADDVFAVAVTLLYLGKEIDEVSLVRSREDEILERADYVIDVGFEYNPDKNLFDHHQKEGAGKRDNGIEYAAFGLVWKHFGRKICLTEEAWKSIDQKIVQPTDAVDNGIEICEPKLNTRPYTLDDMFGVFNLNWEERQESDATSETDKRFRRVVTWAKEALQHAINKEEARIRAGEQVKKIYEATEDKRIIILDKNYSWRETLVEFPDPRFVISPYPDVWIVKAVPKKGVAFESRAYFPKSWAGKEKEEMVRASGVEDAYFCHRARFIASAKSKEGAVKLAKLALESEE